MNMWGLTPEFVGLLEEGFVEFFENIKGDEAKELKGEYLLPIYIDELLKKESKCQTSGDTGQMVWRNL